MLSEFQVCSFSVGSRVKFVGNSGIELYMQEGVVVKTLRYGNIFIKYDEKYQGHYYRQSPPGELKLLHLDRCHCGEPALDDDYLCADCADGI